MQGHAAGLQFERLRSADHGLQGVLSILALLVAQHEQVKTFHFLACPRGFAQKLQARSDAGVVREAANRDALAQVIPAVMVGQAVHKGFQGQAVQGVAHLRALGSRCGQLVRGRFIVVHGLLSAQNDAKTGAQALDRFHKRFNSIKLTGSRKPWAMSARVSAKFSKGVRGLGLALAWGAGKGVW